MEKVKLQSKIIRNYKLSFPSIYNLDYYRSAGSTIINISDVNGDKARVIIRNGFIKVYNYYDIPLKIEKEGKVLYTSN